ncbi:unnamed protein product, partial [Mesorhabditis spiculigera]
MAWWLTNRYRAIVVAITFLCLTAINSNYIIINFTFICMDSDMSHVVEDGNGTLISRYSYDPYQKSLLVFAVGAGSVFGTLPFNFGFIRWGAK